MSNIDSVYQENINFGKPKDKIKILKERLRYVNELLAYKDECIKKLNDKIDFLENNPAIDDASNRV